MTRGFFLCVDESHMASATLQLLLLHQHLHNQRTENAPDHADEQLEQKSVDRHYYTSLPCRIKLDEGCGRGKYSIEFKSVKGMISCPSIKTRSAEHGT